MSELDNNLVWGDEGRLPRREHASETLLRANEQITRLTRENEELKRRVKELDENCRSLGSDLVDKLDAAEKRAQEAEAKCAENRAFCKLAIESVGKTGWVTKETAKLMADALATCREYESDFHQTMGLHYDTEKVRKALAAYKKERGE